ncbi:DUF1768-domain-containing protein [Dendrothele bispora CBS 962.96]|uniref:DUF1768-domain-containing protein n=1 Tax=Dendrothele bispora (strain CBS 962.96) TaxID=1314807 RepID=A0A4S8LXZ5_DENBC|nr:DUF1768-domain-containing protein [Dendrothele bispora CBS 962.96]
MPRTSIFIRTTPSSNSSHSSHNTSIPVLPSPMSPINPSGPPQVEYRVELEERRKRTVYVTSDIPPSQWGSQDLGRLLRHMEDNKRGNSVETEPDFRCKSLSEEQILSSGYVPRSKSAQELYVSNHPIPNSRVSRYQSHRQTLSPFDASKSPVISTAPNSPRYSCRQNSPIRPKVYFYHKDDPHYGFTNFSPHPVIYKGKRYPTSEHLFQSFKFQDHKPGLAEHIRTCSERPSVAFSEARRFQPEVRPDWKDVNIEKMDITLSHKFRQHPDLLQELLDTGDAELIEDSDKDAFWGIGADRQGRNELGKALERLRAELR